MGQLLDLQKNQETSKRSNRVENQKTKFHLVSYLKTATQAKMTNFEIAVRTPTIIRAPWLRTSVGRVTNVMGSTKRPASWETQGLWMGGSKNAMLAWVIGGNRGSTQKYSKRCSTYYGRWEALGSSELIVLDAGGFWHTLATHPESSFARHILSLF